MKRPQHTDLLCFSSTCKHSGDFTRLRRLCETYISNERTLSTEKKKEEA